MKRAQGYSEKSGEGKDKDAVTDVDRVRRRRIAACSHEWTGVKVYHDGASVTLFSKGQSKRIWSELYKVRIVIAVSADDITVSLSVACR